jgi:hypothetical protein
MRRKRDWHMEHTEGLTYGTYRGTDMDHTEGLTYGTYRGTDIWNVQRDWHMEHTEGLTYGTYRGTDMDRTEGLTYGTYRGTDIWNVQRDWHMEHTEGLTYGIYRGTGIWNVQRDWYMEHTTDSAVQQHTLKSDRWWCYRNIHVVLTSMTVEAGSLVNHVTLAGMSNIFLTKGQICYGLAGLQAACPKTTSNGLCVL